MRELKQSCTLQTLTKQMIHAMINILTFGQIDPSSYCLLERKQKRKAERMKYCGQQFYD